MAPPADIADEIAAVLATEPPHARTAPALERHPGTASRPLTLWGLVRPALPQLLVASVLMAGEAVTTQLGPLLIQQGIDRGILAGDRDEVIRAAIFFALASLAGNATSGARIWLTGRIGLRLTTDLRVRLFTHLQRLPLAWLRSERSGRLLARLTSDVESLTQLLQDGIASLAVQGLTLIVVTVILLRLHLALALVVLFAIVPLMTALTLWFRKASAEAHGTARERIADVLADLQENLLGARVITALGRAPRNAGRHRHYVDRYRDAELEIARVHSIYTPSIEAIAAGGQVVLLGVGGAMVLRGSLQVGELTAFLLYLGSFFGPIQQLVNFHGMYQRGMASTRKISDILAVEPTVTEPADATEIRAARGEIHVKNVTYRYSEDAEPALRDVSLTIPAGATVAVVGKTGAGKSTLAKVLTREFDPDEGGVLVDGVDVRSVTLASLRRSVLMVPQDAYVFRGSLADNLTLGVAEADEAQLLRVCDDVGLTPLIERLGGLHEPVTKVISAGERQLIALARALVFDPKVLVLDESTSNLDLATEVAVDHAMRTTLSDRTAILIAHRLSTALAADLVAVLEAGRLVQFGSPSALLAEPDGAFASMHADWTIHAG